MARHYKPRAGSRSFWPKKRAKGMYSTPQSFPDIQEVVPLNFAAYKAGMTRIITNAKIGPEHAEHEVIKAVTVLETPPLIVAGVNVYRKGIGGLVIHDTIMMENPTKDLARKTTVPKETKKDLAPLESQIEKMADVRLLVQTQPRKTALHKKKPDLFEISLGSNDVKAKWEFAKKKLGGELKVDEVFRVGENVDVKSVTKGQGYQGPVKRFGVKVRSRKNEKKRRHVGSLGPITPSRVLPGKLAMPGQLGFQTRTEYNKKVMKIGSDGLDVKGGWLNYGHVSSNYVLVEGSVPGPKKRLIMMRKAMRAKVRETPVEVKKVFTDSQQGL